MQFFPPLNFEDCNFEEPGHIPLESPWRPLELLTQGLWKPIPLLDIGVVLAGATVGSMETPGTAITEVIEAGASVGLMETPRTENTGVVETNKAAGPWKPLELLTQGSWGLTRHWNRENPWNC